MSLTRRRHFNIKAAVIDVFGHVGAAEQVEDTTKTNKTNKVVKVNVLAFSMGFSSVLAICLPGQI